MTQPRYRIVPAALAAFLAVLAPPASAGTVALAREAASRATAVSEISITAPDVFTTREGAFTQIQARAGSGDPHSLIVITSTGAPAGMSFSFSGPGLSPAAAWIGTPLPGTAGPYVIHWHAEDQFGATDDAITNLTVQVANRPPDLAPPTDMTVREGATATQTLSATDPDGDAVTFGKADGPIFMTVGPAGLVTLTPHSADAGAYQGRVSASDGVAVTESGPFAITVEDSPGIPVANPGGPYEGISNVALFLSGTASFDPDGGELTYAWNFGDGTTGVGPFVNHTFLGGGIFHVCLVVTDPEGLRSDEVCTTVTLHSIFFADMFTVGPKNKAIHLGGKQGWCVQVEPRGNAVPIEEIIPSSIRLTFGPRQVPADPARVLPLTDQNGDGIPEITCCFSAQSLRALFFGLLPGKRTLSVGLTGVLASGAFIQSGMDIDVVLTGAPLGAAVSPNPLNPGGILSFETARPGWARVSVYEPGGRLVRTVLDETSYAAGAHLVPLGGALSSGIYFYRIETAEGRAVGRFVVLK